MGSCPRANGVANEWSRAVRGASLQCMTTSTSRPMLAGRQPARAVYEHAAGVLAAARGLEAESRDPEAAAAIAPTLACIEAALEAVAEATARLGDHVVERYAEPHSTRSAGAVRAFQRLHGSLAESSAACLRARGATRSLLGGADEGADEPCG